MNKKIYILTILMLVMAINTVFSQTTTKKLSYQAVVRNAANELVVNQNLSVEITILNANNVPQYKETHATVPTNQNGLLWLWVGDGTPTLGTMDNVVWKDATIKSVFTLPDGSTVEQNTPVTAMPYAYFADEVDTIFLQDYLTTHNFGNEDYVTHEELNDTLNHYYDTTHMKTAIHDTADVLRGLMVDAANDGKITIKKNNVEVDHFTVNQADDKAINITVPTTVAELTDADNYVTNAKLGDTLNAYYDTTDTKAAIHDTANALRGEFPSVNNGQITIAVNHGTVDNPSFNVNQGGTQTVTINIPEAATVNNGQLTIVAAGDTTRFTANQATNDTVRLNQFATKDTLANFATTEDLANYEPREELCGDVKNCIKDTLDKYTTTNQLDSVIRKYDYATNTRVTNDSTWLQANIDTVSSHIRAIIPTVSDKTVNITVNNNTPPAGSFTLNQNTDANVNIPVPTKISDLVNDSRFADTTANNHFTGINTVPSGYNISGNNATNATNCGNVVVNACDLWAVFDSLDRRMRALENSLAETQQELEELKNSTPPVYNNLVLSDITSSSIKATADFSSTGAAITTYEFCIKKSEVANATTQCFTSTSNVFTFNGLDPYTAYDITAKATNMAGTTSSTTKNARTLANEPSGVFTTQTVYPLGIKVTIEQLDFGGDPTGSVKIYFKKKGNDACSNDIADYGNPLTVSVNLTAEDDSTFVQTISDLESMKEYCVMVELINDNSSKVLGPEMETSGSAVTLTITSNANSGTLDVCEKSSTVAVYTATPSEGNPGDYAYQWEIVGTSVSQNTENTNTVEFAHAVGTYTVSCTATSNTSSGVQVSNTYSVTVTNTGRVPSFSICYDSLQVTLNDILHADTIKWGDNAETVLSSNTASHLYQTSQAYTVTATNNSGCTASKEFPVGLSTMHPCTVATKYDNEDGSGNTISTLQDYDGNSYVVVQIGNQCWMKSNLRTTHYSDGTAITNGTGENANSVVSDYTAYYYRPVATSVFDDSYDFTKYNVNTHGLYYNWNAVMHGASGSNEMPSGVQGVCPTGWHVPSLREWDTLIAFVQTLPGATYWDLHSIGYVHVLAGGCEWDVSSDGRPGHYKSPVRNSSEFSILPTGQAANLFSYNKVAGTDPQSAFFWTSTASTPFAGSPQSYVCEIYDGQSTIRKDDSYNLFGYSIRCVRDFEVADPTNKPTVTTNEATNIGMYAATMNGEITIPDGVTISAKGFKWKTAESSNYNTEYLTGNDMTLTLNGLTAGTDYSYFAFAIYDNGTAFGVEKTFTTWSKPSVSTGSVTNISVNSATLNGALSNPNGVTITSKGFEWKFTEGNSNYTRIVVDGTDNNFSANFTNLTSSKGYTIRTFVEYDGGPSYGGETSFMTKTPPTVNTNQTVTYVGANSAALSGEITVLGNVNITERGIEVKVTGTPDDSYVKYPDTGTGSGFTVDPANLTDNTSYTFRAYAIYEGGIAYGEPQSFTTKVSPTVITDGASNIGVKTANINGTFTNTGEVAITAKGFEWKLASAQTFTPVTVTGDDLTYNLTGLTKSTEYEYKAFITYDGHTVYGMVVTFSTNAAPEVSATTASNVTTNGATLSCTFNAQQNTITKEGFLWKVAEGNNTYDTVTEGVTVNGEAMTYVLSGLTSNTNYTCCAFVTTADTTVYGDAVTFPTNVIPTVTTDEATNVGTTSATLNGTANANNNDIVKGFKWKLFSATNYNNDDSITITDDNLTYNLSNLNPSTKYTYCAFVTYSAGTVYGEEVTFTTKTPPILSVTTNSSSEVTVCSGGSTAVTYTASIENDDPNDYTFTWHLSSDLDYYVNNNMCTVIFNSTNPCTVTCTATPISGNPLTKDTTVTAVLATGTVPSFTTCQNDYTRSVTIKSQNVISNFDWGGEGTQSGNDFTYATDGVYTITATNGNCSSTKTVPVGVATTHPCTVSTAHTDNTIYTSVTGGLEALDGEGKVATVQDQEGHTYAVIQIGNQCWMRTNLRTAKFNNGEDIQTGTGIYDISTTEPYYYKNNSYIDFLYGYFYNWPAAASNICPKGWHVPTQTDWLTLINTTGASTPKIDGTGAVYLAGSCGWNGLTSGVSRMTPNSYNNPDRDKWGFTAIPAGRYGVAQFLDSGEGVYFWTSIEVDAGSAKCWYLGAGYPGLENDALDKEHGRLVRCMRDLESGSSITPPSVSTGEATSVGAHVATLNGIVNNPDNVNITVRGFKYKAAGNDNYIQVTADGDTMSYSLSDLTNSTEYSFFSFATMADSTVYGDTLSFTTLSVDLPSVTTSAATNIGTISATLNGTVTANGCTITAQGFEWKATENGIYKTVYASGETMTHSLTGLTASTGYTYRAFATTASGTVTGDEITFTTTSAEPSATDCGIVTDASEITYNTIMIGSQCWMKENLRTTKYNDGTNITTYYNYSSSSIPLERRGYLYDWNVVMNQSGEHDICPSGWHVPSMDEWETLNVSEFQCNGDIARALAADTDWYVSTTQCAECDVCYNLSNNNSSGFGAIPAGFHANSEFDESGSSANFWTSSFNNSYNEPKYVIIDIWSGYRPYSNPASNGYSVRCVRDGEVSVTTSAAANISTTGAWLLGKIIARGNAITEQGFYWKATEGGTYAKVTSTGGSLTYILSGLTPNTSYTYYAFATTTAGTVFGDEVTFTTSEEPSVSNCGTVTDVNGNTYNTVMIGSQCWMKENLRTKGNLSSFDNITDNSTPFYYQPTTSDFAEYTVSTYGLYYNRSAALNNYDGTGIENPSDNIQGICPTGWHIPSKSEWQTLKVTTSSSPCKLAESSDWNGNDWGEDDVSPGNYGYPYRNQTGFSALPSGQFDASSGTMDATYPPHSHALFWSSSFYNNATYYLRLWYYDAPFYFETCDNNYAFPVRCVRD